MQDKIYLAETELDKLEKDFESGEMNAFGNRDTQLEFFSSFKKISSLEQEVFYQTCAIMELSKTGEASAFKSVMNVAAENGTALDSSYLSLDNSEMFGTAEGGIGSTFRADPKNSSTYRATNRLPQGFPPMENDDAPPEEQEHDKAFVDVARHFEALEKEFENLSTSLQAISSEIIRVDAMAEKLNSLYESDEQMEGK